MTHMLSIAIVVLVFLFYLSTHTLIIPLTFGYLFFLYNLKELPKSKYKSSLWIFGILGMIISLLYSDLLIIQEILVMMCVSVLAYMMDEKTYHGILSGLTVIFGLPLAQMIAYEKNTTFGSNIYSGICLGAIILSFALFYFYNYLNQYLNDIPQPKEINLPKKYPFILKISIILMTVIGFLYSFQKLYIQFREGETMYYLYTPTKKDSPILPEYPISVSVSESSFFFQTSKPINIY